MSDKPVYYFARFVPGYRIPVLESLNRRLDGRLVVCSGQPPGASSLQSLMSDRNPDFRQFALRNTWLRGDTLHVQPYRKAMDEIGDPAVVLAEESPRSLTLPFLLRHARKRGAGTVLWGHFSSLHRTFAPDRDLRDRYRLSLARRAEACACYTEGVAELLRPYVPQEKLFVARNTIDLAPVFAQYDALDAEGKDAVRKRLSIPAKVPVIAFVGRLIPEKGTSMLLETFSRLRTDMPAVLLVIGEGPERTCMETYVSDKSIPGVRFLGARFEDELAPHLYAADMLLVPGYLGLVINHAFALGLPVVSMRHPAGIASHSPEIEYVQSGYNGLLCEGDTAEDLYLAVRGVIGDLPRLSRNALQFARELLSAERMVDGLYDAIVYAENRRRA